MRKSDFLPLKTGGKYPFPVTDVPLQYQDCFKNNGMVKSAGVSLNLSLEHVQEIIKCRKDVVYFFRKYLRISSIDKGLVPFDLRDYQEEMLDLFANNNFSLAVTSRQAGKTQTVAGFILHFAMFSTEPKDVAILANKGSQAQEVLHRVRSMFEELPYFLQVGVTTWNKQAIEFETGSRVFSAATSSSSIRGKSVAFLYIDEAAFIEKDWEFYESTYPVITSGDSSRVIMTSTPKGKRGVFHNLYEKSLAGVSEYKSIMVKWDRIPGKDAAWKAKTISNTSLSQFMQEFECVFAGSSGSLISPDYLQKMFFINPINEVKEDQLQVYYAYIPGNKYVAVVDCAGGVGKDYSVVSVFDVTFIPYKTVAVYRNNTISPQILPYTIVAICTAFGECPVLVETNNDVGATVINTLYQDLEYEGVILTGYDTKRKEHQVGINAAIPGIKTTARVKAIGCSNLKTFIENGKLEVNDATMIDELGTFVAKGKSYEADSGAHDDTVMTLVLFSWLIKQEFFKDYSGNNIQKSLYETNREMLMSELTPVGFMPTHADTPNPIQVEEIYSDIFGMVNVTYGGSFEDFMKR
jgi:hypothetical protein